MPIFDHVSFSAGVRCVLFYCNAGMKVKFWDFEVANGNLGLVHTRSLNMTDDVLCVRYSKHKQESKLLLAGVGL